MNRRELILLLGGAMTAPRTLRAQQKAMPVVGYLGSSAPGPTVPWTAAFRQGLSETGYVEGQNLAIEYRWAESRYDRLPALAADLVRRNVDVIAAGGTPAALAAKWATQTIPIVFMGVGDPVGSGLVAGLARPGGNLTGISEMTTDLMSKRLELLFEMVPQATVIALLVNPNIAITEGVIREVQAAAGAAGVQLPILKAGTESEIDAAFAALAELHAGGLVIGPDAFFSSRREQLLGLCHATPFRRSITCVNSPRPAALSPMERASPLYFARPAFTPEGSSRAPSRPICRSSSRRRSSWSSISAPPRRSA